MELGLGERGPERRGLETKQIGLGLGWGCERGMTWALGLEVRVGMHLESGTWVRTCLRVRRRKICGWHGVVNGAGEKGNVVDGTGTERDEGWLGLGGGEERAVGRRKLRTG